MKFATLVGGPPCLNGRTMKAEAAPEWLHVPYMRKPFEWEDWPAEGEADYELVNTTPQGNLIYRHNQWLECLIKNGPAKGIFGRLAPGDLRPVVLDGEQYTLTGEVMGPFHILKYVRPQAANWQQEGF